MKDKVLVIVGPTASGKTTLGIEIARKFNGEIISADSRQVYKGLDIGSGKVMKEEMGGVPHHLLDVAEPTEVYTVHDYVRDGRKAITDVTLRGQLPIIVGGTFFYVDALLGRAGTPDVPPNTEFRKTLEPKSTEELYKELSEKDPRRATDIDEHNKVRLIRALEIVDAIGTVPETKSEEQYDVLTIGINIEKDTLHKNIHERLAARIEHGMIEEVANLHARDVPWERFEELGLEYRYVAEFLQDKISKEEMIEFIDSESRKFAKRQMTWLKRDKTIHWFAKDETGKIADTVGEFLAP